MLTVRVNGDTKSVLANPSGSLARSLSYRDTWSFSYRESSYGGTPPQIGQKVKVEDIMPVSPFTSRWTFFYGHINDFTMECDPGTTNITWTLNCVDRSKIFDRFVVKATWVNAKAGDIFRDVVNRYCQADGISAARVTDGPTIPLLDADGVTATDVFDSVVKACLQAGVTFAYYLDPDDVLNTFDVTDGIGDGPTDFAYPSTEYQTAKLSKTDSSPDGPYRNRQLIMIASAVSDGDTTDTFHGDGSTRNFTLSKPSGAEPTAKLNGAANTVGQPVEVVGTATTPQWTNKLNDTAFNQNPNNPPLGATDVLVVTYKAYVPESFVITEDTAEQTARAAIEGGSGIHEHVDSAEVNGVLLDPASYGAALLARFKNSLVTLELKLPPRAQSFWKPGQTFSFTDAHQGFSASTSFMVIEVKSTLSPGKADDADTESVGLPYFSWETTLIATAGVNSGSWQELFKTGTPTSATLSAINNAGSSQVVYVYG